MSPHCTYANQVMLESATRRYIDGRSSSEIALGMNNGISERHVRRLSNTALDIFPVIHSSNADKLRSCLKSYILQIDGTTDSDFSMIVAVRDSISDFVLHVDRCSLIVKHMEVFLHAGIPSHIRTAARIIMERYRRRETMLFANNAEHTIPRTNNGMERFFRKLRRNVRKRTGNMSTGTVLTKTGESLALFQNMENPEYVKIVFGSRENASVFAKLRKPFIKKGMTTQRKKELMKKGTEMPMKDSLPNTPCTPEFMEQAYSTRRSPSMI